MYAVRLWFLCMSRVFFFDITDHFNSHESSDCEQPTLYYTVRLWFHVCRMFFFFIYPTVLVVSLLVT